MDSNGAWDGPVALKYGFNEAAFSSDMQQGYDSSGIGRKSGNLREALGMSHLTVKKDAQGIPTEVTISDMPVYARIQDRGGHVPERFPVRAQAMHWDDIFAKRAAAFDLPGFQYIDKGINIFGNRISETISVEWA